MESFDTNVVVRLLVKDDPEQCARAEDAWRRAIGTDGAFVPLIVLVELSWVLRIAYRLDRPAIADALQRVLDGDGVVAERAEIAVSALAAFRAGAADFADCVIIECARAAGALPLRTFDARLARVDGALLVG